MRINFLSHDCPPYLSSMAKGQHRSQIKRERNANKDTRPSAKLSYARVSVQKAFIPLLFSAFAIADSNNFFTKLEAYLGL